MADENTGASNPNPAGQNGQSNPDGQQGSNGVTFTEEQQAHLEAVLADRLSRANKAAEAKWAQKITAEREKWEAERQEAEAVAKMSEKERIEHNNKKQNDDLTAAQKRADELQAQLNHVQMVSEASKILADKGYTADEATLSFVVRDTAEDTTQAINDFVTLIDAKVEEKRQASLVGSTPNNAGAGNGAGKSFGAQMAERANSRGKSGVADSFFGTTAK